MMIEFNKINVVLSNLTINKLKLNKINIILDASWQRKYFGNNRDVV